MSDENGDSTKTVLGVLLAVAATSAAVLGVVMLEQKRKLRADPAAALTKLLEDAEELRGTSWAVDLNGVVRHNRWTYEQEDAIDEAVAFADNFRKEHPSYAEWEDRVFNDPPAPSSRRRRTDPAGATLGDELKRKW